MTDRYAAELTKSTEPTVLVVDDDPAAVEFLKTVIAQSTRVPRYRVTTANSGFRAEQACRTCHGELTQSIEPMHSSNQASATSCVRCHNDVGHIE